MQLARQLAEDIAERKGSEGEESGYYEMTSLGLLLFYTCVILIPGQIQSGSDGGVILTFPISRIIRPPEARL